MSLIPIDEVVYLPDITTHEPTTGAITDADSTPTFDVFEEATDTPILSAQNRTKRTGLTGDYRGSFTASAANGFEAGKWYNVVDSATVGGVSAKKTSLHFRVAPAEAVAGVPKVDVDDWKGATAAAMTGDAFARLGAPAGASVSADVAAAKVDTAAIKLKTDNLPSDPADASDIATAFTSVLSAISGLNNLSSAQVLTQVNAALDTILSATIPADGTRPTLRQGVYMSTQFLLERSVSGTVLTVKNPDGTTLMTFTLGDATSPTSLTRAT